MAKLTKLYRNLKENDTNWHNYKYNYVIAKLQCMLRELRDMTTNVNTKSMIFLNLATQNTLETEEESSL